MHSQGGKKYPTYNKEQGNRNGYILRRNCLVEHATEGKKEGRIEVMGRRVRRHKQLLVDLKEERVLETERGTLDLRTTERGILDLRTTERGTLHPNLRKSEGGTLHPNMRTTKRGTLHSNLRTTK